MKRNLLKRMEHIMKYQRVTTHTQIAYKSKGLFTSSESGIESENIKTVGYCSKCFALVFDLHLGVTGS